MDEDCRRNFALIFDRIEKVEAKLEELDQFVRLWSDRSALIYQRNYEEFLGEIEGPGEAYKKAIDAEMERPANAKSRLRISDREGSDESRESGVRPGVFGRGAKAFLQFFDEGRSARYPNDGQPRR